MTYILSRNIEIVFPFKNIEAIINKYLKQSFLVLTC